MSHLELLITLGFRRVGGWVKEADGLEFSVLPEVRSATKSLYAFVAGSEVLYVGKANGRFAGRLYGYRRPAKTQPTNSRIHPLILSSGDEIHIYHFQTTEELKYRGVTLNLSAALEDALIELMHPRWNMVGKKKSLVSVGLDPLLEPEVSRPT